MKIKNTKRALLMSALSLLTCVSMLVGSTFAWFTDSVTSVGNRIQAGTLDIDLVDADGNSLEGEMIEWVTIDGKGQNDILWEPGCTYVTEPFKVVNKGNLDLQFKVEVTGIDGDAKLLEVIEFTPSGFAYGESVQLNAGSNPVEMTLTAHMKEEAGNEYQGLAIEGIAITVLATQVTSESDSFDNTYDALATYANEAAGKLADGQAAINLEVRDTNETKVASAMVPAAAVADDATVKISVEESKYDANITVAAEQETKAFDVVVTGLKDNNTTPVKVSLRIAAGLDPTTVKLYHYDDEIDCDYNPTTGYVTFESATFSPFTVVYDAESVYVPNVPAGVTAPKAVVDYAAEYVNNADIEWGNYGQWSPTAGLDANLEAAFVFQCPENLTAEVREAFEYWYCDFYVSLDRDLAADQIFLGGNYGDFGWIGFHNGDLALAANEEIGLLKSVTTNPWTYADVESFVGTFTCGVGDVDDALEGATFTVKLRLTNPANEAEYYDVNVVKHTFGGNSNIDGTTVVTTADGLQDAVNNGDENISLGGDIDLSQGIVIPGM